MRSFLKEQGPLILNFLNFLLNLFKAYKSL